jgi:hypothetical protein
MRLEPGTYVAAQDAAGGPLAGATVVLEASLLAGSLTPPGAPAISLTLSATPPAAWEPDCGTMTGHSLLEVRTVTPDPLVVGALSLPQAKLSATCFRSEVQLVSGGQRFKFRRAPRP